MYQLYLQKMDAGPDFDIGEIRRHIRAMRFARSGHEHGASFRALRKAGKSAWSRTVVRLAQLESNSGGR